MFHDETSMIVIKQISPQNLTPADIQWIEKGCEGSYDKANASHQIDAAKNGNAWIFQISGDCNGVFVLARGNDKEKELVMTAVAGKGLIKHFPEVYGEVKKLCEKVKARRLIGYVSRAGLAAIYKNRTKAKPVATLFSEDLE